MDNIIKPIPFIKFKENKAFVILATQRSGSTMLCKDVHSLEVLGSPDEHFWPLLQKHDPNKTGEDFLQSFLINGNTTNSDYYSIKLMYDYLHKFGFWVSDRTLPFDQNTEYYRKYAINFFLENFDDVKFVYLTRKNKFEQALSHYRAVKTSVFHLVDNKEIRNVNITNPMNENQLLESIDVNLFDRLYNKATNEDQKLKELIDEMGIKYVELVYEEIRNDYPHYLYEMAKKMRIPLDESKYKERKIKKIVSDDFALQFREKLKEVAQKEYI